MKIKIIQSTFEFEEWKFIEFVYINGDIICAFAVAAAAVITLLGNNLKGVYTKTMKKKRKILSILFSYWDIGNYGQKNGKIMQ